ncbi:MAG: ABC-2 transporter permease [Clostridia bacterium]
MTGLILKDLINLKKVVGIYCVLIVFYIIMGISMKNGASFMCAILCFIGVMLPMSAMAFDEQSKWDAYAATLPISRKTIVLSRYLLGVLMAAIALLASILFVLITSKNVAAEIPTLKGTASIGILFFSAIMQPLFKFGVEKGRIMMFIVVFVVIFGATLIPKLIGGMPSETAAMSAIIALPVISVAVLIASFFISVGIYRKKEF